MASLYSANITKYRAGGSGDNIIADGYIKTVEKVWIDSYAVAAAIATTSSLCIGRVPAGKKLTDVIVYLPILSEAGTTSVVYLDTAATTSVAPWGGFLISTLGASGLITDTSSVSTVRLGPTKALQAMTVDTELFIMINPATTITAGTIRTIIKYT